MPLDPSIAMGARLPQISVLPDSPVNAMARVEEVRGAQMANQLRAMQMQQAQREEQQNELANRLYAESIGEGGEIDYGKLMQGMAQGGMASRIPGVLEQRAATQSRASERQLREEQVRNQQLDAAYKMLKAATPENYAQLRAMGIARAPALAGVLPEQFDQRVIDALTGQMEQYFAVQPGGQVFSRRTGQPVGEQVPFKPEPAPQSKLLSPEEEAQRIRIARESRPPAQPREPAAPVAVLGPDGKPMLVPREQAIGMTPASAATTTPSLTPVQQQKRRDAVGKAFVSANNTLQVMQDVLDSAKSVKESPGLGRATGYSGVYLPSITGGEAAKAEVRLANLKGKITALGKAAAASSGAIGTIATQEWKILSDQIAVVDPVKGEAPLREQIGLIEDRARAAMTRIRDEYERIHGEDFELFPQFSELRTPSPSAEGMPANRQAPSGPPNRGRPTGQPKPSATGGVDMNNPLLR